MTALTRPFRRLLGRSAPDPTPRRRARRRRAAPARSSPASPSTSPRPTRSSPTSSPRRGRWTSPGSSSPRRRSSELRAAGVALVVPLVTQGELIGTLNLGPRLSEQDYSTDDRRLLATLAAQAAPAIRVAQLVREQAAEAAERERFEQELKVAQLIQQQFLPRELPNLPEWQVAAYYGPARVVGGDFYDFIDLGEGRIGVVVGDVTDKGVPAALVMARTHSILRAEAPRLVEPGAGPRPGERAPRRRRCRRTCSSPACTASSSPRPAASCSPTPATTCPTCGRRTASSSCGRPACRSASCRASPTRRPRASSGRATAMLLYSDGIVEAARPGRRDVRLPAPARRRWRPTTPAASSSTACSTSCTRFTGPGWEQEDDITIVTLRRSAGAGRRLAEDGPRSRHPRRRGGRPRWLADAEPLSRSPSRAPSATSGPRCSASPRPSRRWAWSPPAWSASRPRSPRP